LISWRIDWAVDAWALARQVGRSPQIAAATELRTGLSAGAVLLRHELLATRFGCYGDEAAGALDRAVTEGLDQPRDVSSDFELGAVHASPFRDCSMGRPSINPMNATAKSAIPV
jgi:hypothetical protein